MWSLFRNRRPAPSGGAGHKPQYMSYGRPPRAPQLRAINESSHPAVVTPGFRDAPPRGGFLLNYIKKTQPDVGGALNYAYDNYGLPLQDVAGAFMVARTPYRPIGGVPLQFFAQSVPTGIGTIPGQLISQPLLNPQGPGAGYDIYS
jgi:hypothetical protein